MRYAPLRSCKLEAKDDEHQPRQELEPLLAARPRSLYIDVQRTPEYLKCHVVRVSTVTLVMMTDKGPIDAKMDPDFADCTCFSPSP
jgi:hypothetical protein